MRKPTYVKYFNTYKEKPAISSVETQTISTPPVPPPLSPVPNCIFFSMALHSQKTHLGSNTGYEKGSKPNEPVGRLKSYGT